MPSSAARRRATPPSGPGERRHLAHEAARGRHCVPQHARRRRSLGVLPDQVHEAQPVAGRDRAQQGRRALPRGRLAQQCRRAGARPRACRRRTSWRSPGASRSRPAAGSGAWRRLPVSLSPASSSSGRAPGLERRAVVAGPVARQVPRRPVDAPGILAPDVGEGRHRSRPGGRAARRRPAARHGPQLGGGPAVASDHLRRAPRRGRRSRPQGASLARGATASSSAFSGCRRVQRAKRRSSVTMRCWARLSA